MAARLWAVVPARFASRRFAGKVLADVGGLTMLEAVWRRVCACDRFERVIVATDDDRVVQVAQSIGADVQRTGPACCGTERVAQVVGDANVGVLNVQADQPGLDPSHLDAVCDRLQRGAALATLATPMQRADDTRSVVKVQIEGGLARSFSRAWPVREGAVYRHIGIYGFAPGWVGRCGQSSASVGMPDLEQVPWLDAGYSIAVDVVPHAERAVDVVADLDTDVRGRKLST